MKKFALILALAPVAAFAGPGLLGTRTDVAPAASGSPVGVLPIVQMLLALGIVAGLVKWVLPRVLNRVTKPGAAGDITVEATSTLGTGNLHIVTTRGRTLLIGATANGMNLIADLTETAPKVEVPASEPVRIQKHASFEEMLAAATVATPEPTPARPVDDVARALERLKALED
ncbi:MAG: flagellar biosynthetic protein FliO [Fimbriimonas sp.]